MQAEACLHATGSVAMHTANLEHLGILIVEDNRSMAEVIKLLVRALGVQQVWVTLDVAEAFEILRTCPIDLVLSDLAMEPIDGIEFTRMLRTAPESPDPYMPLIMLTGHTERSKVKAARDAGVNEFLSKPISPQNLFDRIIEVINNPRAFIRCSTYVGPCRRRKQIAHAGPERRGRAPSAADAVSA